MSIEDKKDLEAVKNLKELSERSKVCLFGTDLDTVKEDPNASIIRVKPDEVRCWIRRQVDWLRCSPLPKQCLMMTNQATMQA